VETPLRGCFRLWGALTRYIVLWYNYSLSTNNPNQMIPAEIISWAKNNSELSGDCWLWNTSDIQGYPTHKDGYKLLRKYWPEIKKPQRVARFFWNIYYGEVLEKGEVLRHLCHNKSCVAPAHLRKGTPQQNAQDNVTKKQTTTLDSNAILLTVLRLKRAGVHIDDIASEFGVTRNAIYNRIRKAKTLLTN
jgi:HNH endonuclease